MVSQYFTRWNCLSFVLPTGMRLAQLPGRSSGGFNGELGNSRDASVDADGTKSMLPKSVAHALRRRNSLRTAIRLWGMGRSCYGFRDGTAHSTQKEETGGTATLSSPSHISQVHRLNCAQKE